MPNPPITKCARQKFSPCGCGSYHSTDSRLRSGYRYRRYICDVCGEKFSTVEVAVEEDIQGHKAGALDALRRKFRFTEAQIQALNMVRGAFFGEGK